MDLHDLLIKQEKNAFDDEDSNENYLQFDFEVGVKVESDESPAIEDWCLQNVEHYQDNIDYDDVKQELDIVEDIHRVHTCSICFRVFADSYSLYQHNLIHLEVVLPKLIMRHLYQCDYCLCYYTSKVNLIRHIRIKHFMMIKNHKKPITLSMQDCHICKKTFTYKHWHSHMRDVHSTERMPCVKCDQTFKCRQTLRRHLLYVHGNIRPSWRFNKVNLGIEFKCTLCPSVFNNRNSYSTHLRNCHSNAVTCTVCQSKLKSRSYLLTHMRRVHFNDGILYECDICFKVFKSQRYLNIHKKNSHHVKIKTVKPKIPNTNN